MSWGGVVGVGGGGGEDYTDAVTLSSEWRDNLYHCSIVVQGPRTGLGVR